MKKCPTCQEYRPKYRFHKSERYTDGYRTPCKDCICKQVTTNRKKYRYRVIEALGKVCAKCGFADDRILHIDHIQGGGCAHRARVFTSKKYYDEMLEDLTKYQLLCPNCHEYKRLTITP